MFVALKLVLPDLVHINTGISLGVIVAIFTAAFAASYFFQIRDNSMLNCDEPTLILCRSGALLAAPTQLTDAKVLADTIVQ
jgi:hypothetical protein